MLGALDRQKTICQLEREEDEDVRPGTYPSDPKANWYEGAGEMIRKYSLVIEGDPYSAYVPELPTILLNGSLWTKSLLAQRKQFALLGSMRTDLSPTLMLR